MVGQTPSHNRIIAKLGGEGIGVAYEVRDTRVDRSVALTPTNESNTFHVSQKEHAYE